ncbi:MAG: helix-turn-helix domain-containing protein [Marinospirillum sp.]|uniref:NBR1-Ig-like domain-containing protein n=1 Tax=Marinospirillum sp. TaxID=2183934 RepID=UPI0019FAD681|nr:NBR1-Ig-like domain-containing protein [Marinospirillum sp.]MBE0505856.1 helix-turn-helix domain-containing protein [Marinospirillum sp.]
MEQNLEQYIRQRCNSLKISLSEVCRQADISRQTLYECWSKDHKYPSLSTLVAISHVLKVHPLRLLQLVFQQHTTSNLPQAMLGDQSAFVADVTYPDGEQVLTGERFRKTWCLQNVGSVPWINRHLACQDDDLMILYGRSGGLLDVAEKLLPDHSILPIPDTQPGETVELSVDFTAPSTPCTVISYWKILNPDGQFAFPNSKGLWVKVRVTGVTQAASNNPDGWEEVNQ